MEKYIFDIGCGRYKINTDALHAFLEEAAEEQLKASSGAAPGSPGAATADGCSESEIEHVFEEVMHLYREYARTGSMDVLVSLKCRLEEVSLRYRSVALAEEVLNINSCLPYERRLPNGKHQEVLEDLHLRN